MFWFQFGVLRFCGPTDFASGVWAGVELETPIGKNDGSVGGVSYFECFPKHGKLTMRSNSQSFKIQKLSKLTVNAKLGKFLQNLWYCISGRVKFYPQRLKAELATVIEVYN